MDVYGFHLEKENRFLRLEQTHLSLHEHCINNLGLREVLDYMNILYTKDKLDKEKLKLGKEKVKLGNVEVEQFKWII
jgi:hypothetical protein